MLNPSIKFNAILEKCLFKNSGGIFFQLSVRLLPVAAPLVRFDQPLDEQSDAPLARLVIAQVGREPILALIALGGGKRHCIKELNFQNSGSIKCHFLQ